MAYSANQTKMLAKVGSAEYVEVPYLMEVPEFGGTPEKIDVTVLSDKTKRYIPGIKDLGDLVFKFLYDNEETTSNFRLFSGWAESDETVSFKLVYPDETAHEFDAIPAVKMDSAAINGALTFSVTMMLQSDIAVTNPA